MNDHDRQILGQLMDLWEPWYEITHTSSTIMPWHAKRRDNGSLFHAREALELDSAMRDNYYAPKPPLLALIPPAS